jgi:hypothetical protein
VEEMKKKYGTDRGTRGIIINRINDVATQMGAKILAYNLLRKCHREEVSAGVVIVAAQCAEGTIVSWVPYLLNLFLEVFIGFVDSASWHTQRLASTTWVIFTPQGQFLSSRGIYLGDTTNNVSEYSAVL